MGVVYVKQDCVVAWSQGHTPLTKGQVWDAEAALVAERPDLFSAEPTHVHGRRPATAEEQGPVEDASAAPGTKRAAVRKPRKTT